MTARQFARLMWSASPRWLARAGSQPAKLGGGMDRAAAGFLAKLHHMGWVDHRAGLYLLSEAGRTVLETHERGVLLDG
mgnify:CR=1 FL=1